MPALISPGQAYAIASQWGSYMRAGDPGAVFYSFPPADATPQGPRHRAELVAYTKDCLKGTKGADRAELKSLLAFFEQYPDSGEEFRADYEDESQALFDGADAFARAYLVAAMFTGVEHREGHPDKDHDKNYDLPPSAIVPDSIRTMLADCESFKAAAADLLAEAYTRDGYGEEQAGHDFWLTRNGHGAGYWDRSPLDMNHEGSLGRRLTAVAKVFGESDLYTGDNGEIALM